MVFRLDDYTTKGERLRRELALILQSHVSAKNEERGKK